MACGNDCMYVVAPPLREVFRDKTTGAPLSGGIIKYFSQPDHTVYKPIYSISGTPEDPIFTPLPNPYTLNSSGTTDTAIYLYPYDENGNLELYYVEVWDSTDSILQFSQDLWPPDACGGSENPTISGLQNFFSNPQFRMHLNIPASGVIPSGQITLPVTNLAPGGWQFQVDDSFTSVNNVSFEGFTETIDVPTAHPPFYTRVVCSSPNPAETMKDLQKKMVDVNFLAGELVTFQFFGFSNAGAINVQLVTKRNYGPAGSAPDEEFITSFTITSTPRVFDFSFTLSDNVAKVIDPDVNTTSITFALRLPSAVLSDSQYTNFLLVQGEFSTVQFPDLSKEQDVALTMAGSIPVPDPNGADTGKFLQLQEPESGADQLIQLAWVIPTSLINQNLIIGGNFDTNPWQRQVTQSITAAGRYYVADRFRFNYGAARTTNATYDKGTNVPNVAQAGILTQTSLRLTSSSTDVLSSNNTTSLDYVIEGYDFLKIAQSAFVISGWVAAPAGTYGVTLTNSGGDKSITFELVILTSNTPQYFVIKVPASPSSGTWNYTNMVGVIISFQLAKITNTVSSGQLGQWINTASSLPIGTSNQFNFFAATGNKFELSLFCVNPGTLPISYIEPDFPILLTRFQRYYEKSYDLDVIPGTISDAGAVVGYICRDNFTNTNVIIPVFYNTSKRIDGDGTTIFGWSPATGAKGKAANGGGSDVTAPLRDNGVTNANWGQFNDSGNTYTMQYTADADFY